MSCETDTGDITSRDTENEPLLKKVKTDHMPDSLSEESHRNNPCSLIQEDALPTYSKRQLRKLRKQENWLKRKPVKRAREKERLKQKRLDARLNNMKLGPSRKELKHSTMANSDCHIRIAIDLSLDDYMNDKAISKCVKQLLRCYSLNRRANNPLQLYLTSLNGKCEKEMAKHSGYRNWDINFHEENYLDIFNNEELVYLTSESDNIIQVLEETKVYIIGGLVDHNAHKGLCFKIAQENNIKHGQLPIAEFLDMKTRKVLTIDHVFEILLGVSEGKPWKEAFLQVLPSRKGAIEKTDCQETTVNDDLTTEQEEQQSNSPTTPIVWSDTTLLEIAN